MNYHIRIIVFFASLFLPLSIGAQSVSKQTANDVAASFLTRCQGALRPDNITKSGENSTANIIEYKDNGHVCIYGVNIGNSWVFVSADERIQPILGYSHSISRTPSFENIPPAMKDLLSSYMEQIRYVQDSVADTSPHPLWNKYSDMSLRKGKTRENDPIVEVVSDLLGYGNGDTIKWSQSNNANGYWLTTYGKEYNKLCPTFDDVYHGHNIVGCVATAMGQVMRYWRWPHSAIVPTVMTDTLGHTSGHVLHEYDWAKMPCQLSNSSSDEEVDEVAGLLRDIGYAINMEYKCDGSYAYTADAADALKSIFKYAPTVEYHSKGINWANRLKDELDHGRPVIYSANRKDTTNHKHGHAFVITGYNSADMFYVNWGYQGRYNAYFFLDSLHTSTDRYYIYDHKAIFGIQPDYPDCSTHNLTNNDIHDDLFEVYNGGPITAQNKTIQYYQSGVIYSGQSITILPPFTIERGADVHLAIKSPYCDLTQMNAPRNMYVSSNDDCVTGTDVSISRNDGFAISPNPVASILHINTSDELSQAKIYTINGQCVMQAAQTDIDVSSLPQGMYILHALTADGQQHQAKFIKQ